MKKLILGVLLLVMVIALPVAAAGSSSLVPSTTYTLTAFYFNCGKNISGKLSMNGAGMGGQTIKIQLKRRSGWRTVKRVKTNATFAPPSYNEIGRYTYRFKKRDKQKGKYARAVWGNVRSGKDRYSNCR